MGKIADKAAALSRHIHKTPPALGVLAPIPSYESFSPKRAVSLWNSGAPLEQLKEAILAYADVVTSYEAERQALIADLYATLIELWKTVKSVPPYKAGVSHRDQRLLRPGKARSLPEYDSDLVGMAFLFAKASRSGYLDGLDVVPDGVATLELTWHGIHWGPLERANFGLSVSNAGGMRGAIVTADWGRAKKLLDEVESARSLFFSQKNAFPMSAIVLRRAAERYLADIYHALQVPNMVQTLRSRGEFYDIISINSYLDEIYDNSWDAEPRVGNPGTTRLGPSGYKY